MPTIQQQVSLAGQCRFGVGGHADFFALVSGTQELVTALDYARQRKLRYVVFAGGSNLFFDDAGFRGLVIRLTNGDWHLDDKTGLVTAGAGFELWTLVRELAERGRGGLEFLANIPGSVGGAVVGNAGCYGRSVSEVLEAATVYDVETGEELAVQPEFFEYDYRHSRVKNDPRFVVTSAVLRTTARERTETLSEIAQELDLRESKHPHNAKCAGSYFKNPGRERPAWQVITEAGLAGARVGDAMLSPRHANFLINAGQATSAEIIELTRTIQQGVHAHSGIALTPEVRYVGPTGFVELAPTP
ncbi:UDP-N-acetylmuramate dehydrogenase [bacterium]|nr:UDP-N-acetylmuramate dehydrogenase [bacterium]